MVFFLLLSFSIESCIAHNVYWLYLVSVLKHVHLIHSFLYIHVYVLIRHLVDVFQSCAWWDSVANQYYTPRETQPGVSDVDYVLYVAAIHSEKCMWQKTVAFAAHCQQEKVLDR